MFVTTPPLSGNVPYDKRKKHHADVVQALFNFLAQDTTWQKYWKKGKEKWAKEKASAEDITVQLLKRIDEMYADLGNKLDEIKRGQAVIYRHLDGKTLSTLQAISTEIRYGRIEQGKLQNALDAVRRVLKYQQQISSVIEKEELRTVLHNIERAIDSGLPWQQSLELTIPIIPLLLAYKVDVGAGVDLAAVWKELLERVQNSRDNAI